MDLFRSNGHQSLRIQSVYVSMSLVRLLANENIRHCLHEIAPASRDTTCISADRVPPPRRTILTPVPAFRALFATFGMIETQSSRASLSAGFGGAWRAIGRSFRGMASEI